MNAINDITENFETLYHPKSALVFYENSKENKAVYVEHFDMDRNGNLINAHPLSVKEASALTKALQTDKEKNNAFLRSKGVLPSNILHINHRGENASVVWFSKSQQRQLHFVNNLEIPSGKAFVPSMVWKATKNNLSVYALASDRRPKENTKLHYAPFFNIHQDGKVCMGTVNIEIKNSASVEEFITQWENYFFGSYFSHLLGSNSPVKGNCVNLWKDLIHTGESFPKEVLKHCNKTLKNLIS